MFYSDVHAHLTHGLFATDLDAVISRAKAASVKHIVVNGLNPQCNDAVLELAKKYPCIVPSLGIYPVDAVNHLLDPSAYPFPITSFDVDAEISRIKDRVTRGGIAAIGEIGLDGYWLQENTYKEQERIFVALVEIAHSHGLPVIVHSRKLEARAIDILKSFASIKVIMHCFGGKVKLAQEASEKYGFCFSIPAIASRSEAFTKMLRELPQHCLLTETDAPYLAPTKGGRSEPKDVVETVAYFCKLKNLPLEEGLKIFSENFSLMFKIKE